MSSQANPRSGEDLLLRIKNAYRLLALRTEQGSNGHVDKVVIPPDSLRNLMDVLRPGAFESMTKIDFAALDEVLLKPVGIYGSRSRIIEFLEEVNAIDAATARDLLTPLPASGVPSGPHLGTGIYLILDDHTQRKEGSMGLDTGFMQPAFLLYWPEENTWNDNATGDICRNRATFMHYLGRLSNQIVALLSKEHMESIVWDDDAAMGSNIAEGEGFSSDENDDDRVFSFTVEKTVEQEENVTVHAGFKFPIQSAFPSRADPDHHNVEGLGDVLKPRVVPGDTRQGLLVTEYIPQRSTPKSTTRVINGIALRTELKNRRQSIQLADDLHPAALVILIENGLNERFKALCEDFERSDKRERHMLGQEFESLCARGKENLAEDIPRLQRHISNQLVQHLVDLTPRIKVTIARLHPTTSLTFITGPEGVVIHQLIPLVGGAFRRLKLHSIVAPGFQDIKRRFIISIEALKSRAARGSVPEATPDELDAAIVTGGSNWNKVIATILHGTRSPPRGSALSPANIYSNLTLGFGWFVGSSKAQDEPDPFIRALLREAPPMSDSVFIQHISDSDYSRTLHDAVTKVRNQALEWLLGVLASWSQDLAKSESEIYYRRWRTELEAKNRVKSQEQKNQHLSQLKARINHAKTANCASTTSFLIAVTTDTAVRKTKSFIFTVSELKDEPAHFMYTLQPLGLMSEDVQRLTMDASIVPRLHIGAHSIQFAIPATSRLWHIQLLERSKCLVVVEDSLDRKICIYLDDDVQIPVMLGSRRPKKEFSSERMGKDFLFSVNEPRRSVALLDAKYRLHVYAIDESYTSLNLRGSPVDLGRLRMGSDAETKFSKMCFISSLDEILLIESSGHARIYSVVQEQFKPAFLKLESPPTGVCSSPDGSCLFITAPNSSNVVQTVSYHTASFGCKPQGILLQLPQAFASVPTTITSFVARRNAYLMAIEDDSRQLSGVRLEITNKASEFTFRAHGEARAGSKGESTCNSLIDCHSEVWTKFPVASTIRRSLSSTARHSPSLTFTAGDHPIPIARLRSYFLRMIRSFEHKTRKPTDGRLGSIDIQHSTSSSLRQSISSEITTYFTGRWIVDLICLIPIHIAVVTSNRFTPLKDGISSPEFEQQLLGADILTIADSISIGWYESMFGSYMASKPVKVVSSMGEQSVGKSYALNHFVDTSFAGSAMRCTEGVWLSVTPTDADLIVSLDFEGIHSIERTSQEDMLLVLFNVALSNLVLFRNNFALSRDVAGMFSFQSSAAQFEPSANPELFRSTLAIIIKDVVESDTKEVVQEFRLKFQKMVQEEKEGNFISRLHRGTVDILPWPVIQSSMFYTLMNKLKKRLDAQDPSHGTASVFLERMKFLMAKLKASDWGALDHALASHRAQLLQNLLPSALAYGVTEYGNEGSYLKNLDTDEAIQPETSSRNHLFLKSVMKEPKIRDELLVKVQQRCIATISGTRQNMLDLEWFSSLAMALHQEAKQRIEYVEKWIYSNTTRFPPEQTDIQLLRRCFSQLSLELIEGVDMCGVKCQNCNLKCILSKYHMNDHDCTTDHCCALKCDECGSKPQEKLCGMIAGHDGNHICDLTRHVCGRPCYLKNKRGCLRACTKATDDAIHLCSARTHSCGKPCRLSLIEQDGAPLCMKPCAIDCRDSHDTHECENRLTCPAKCRLCSRLCSITSHSHPLQHGAIHLCGQEHHCKEPCGSRGICRIDSAPRSIETTFVGRNETFQYTKYTQVANKLPCVVGIPPNKLKHDGAHAHTTNPVAFHFCETRCPFCLYFCNLAINHHGLHSTTHGNMEQTSWSFEGDDSTTREIAGRKFSTGDSGAPMYCNMFCKELGRHVHIDFCRAPEGEHCADDTVEHITTRMNPKPSRAKDWVTHASYWARTDPYSQDLQDDFSRCDSECNGDEHKATGNIKAQRSFCTLSMFHKPISPNTQSTTGYISRDGHSFDCENPGLHHTPYHVIFVLDRSSSMSHQDRLPLAGQAATRQITHSNNNRYGAVLSAVYSFWTARASASPDGIRRDTYSVVVFDSTAVTVIANDLTRDADALLVPLLNVRLGRGTDFGAAIREAQSVMEDNWSVDRIPCVIFLSDGEAHSPLQDLREICDRAVWLGSPLSFFTVSFAARSYSPVLDSMTTLATNIYRRASPGASRDTPCDTPCGSYYANDSIQLAQMFLSIADSMRQTRGALVRK
ncbi:uncharacterized protein EI90DRAFT_2913057 [Cantharellus anzutake]|uniref:uncharacterized protein n=1 Tax=Cantharellus anzutake TaxID=1750568 RepID=UPI00190541CE|nr:uncharacterized protein EI90DRAFT_2913057 [Cantharellus anzutake]KAF8335492.1 hypothetical protein EI90DRAFT_2913057 [Cantharellus anzutake]